MDWHFLREFFREPHRVGAVAPSSPVLGREIVSGVGLEAAGVVIEYGPGTGAFTAQILPRLRPGAVYLAIERNPSLADSFRKRFPGVPLMEGCVENVATMLQSAGADRADCIISGLPWAAFDADLQDRLLGATLDVLCPGGTFATFAYLQGLLLPAGKRFKHKLRQHFARVTRSPVVWRNLPPAFVYRCEK